MLQRRKYPEAKIYKQDLLFKNSSLNTPKSIAVVLHAELRKLNIASLLKFLKLLKKKIITTTTETELEYLPI